MEWHLKAFDALTPHELYALMVLRQKVFVVEQKCAYLDADGYDDRALHLWASADDVAIAAARIFGPGIKYRECSIGRVVTASEARRTGLGRELMARALALVDRTYSPCSVRISAQSYLERFYRSFGFAPIGAPYLEDDIVHIEMLRGDPAP